METKKYFIVGGSSGIGFEIVKELSNRGDEIYVASRTSDKLTGLRGVHHLRFDVSQPPDLLEGLPEVLHGLAYCPGTIRLKPFQRRAGGEARRLTSVSTGVLSFQWSPDGQRLAYVALQPKRPEQEALENKGYGFTFFEENLRSRNLYIMTVSPEEEAEADQLTEGISVWSFVFAPDGNTIALAASERNLVDHQYMFQSIYLFDIRKKSQTTLVPQPHKIGNLKFSPDGSYLVFSAALEQKDHQVSQVYVVPTAGGERRNLTVPDFPGQCELGELA